jgi:hypothetical protein
MRTGHQAGDVFDALLKRGQISLHPTEVERLAALTDTDRHAGMVIADTREQVSALNAAIRDTRLATGEVAATRSVTTAAGEHIGPGDRIATRRNDRHLGVANRDRWTVTSIDNTGTLHVRGRAGERGLPASYVHEHVELAYASTVHGAQGETVDRAHLLIGDATGAAAAYVGMTRGRHHNTAHLVADTVQDARAQWIEVFNRDRADLGPAHAAQTAAENIERYGPQAPQAPPTPTSRHVPTPPRGPRRPPEPIPGTPAPGASPGIGR